MGSMVSNILKKDSDQLLEIANNLVDNRQISKANRYYVSRFALLQLLKSEKKK